jgi:leucyl aminopeptidase (aminopeptidase T)
VARRERPEVCSGRKLQTFWQNSNRLFERGFNVKVVMQEPKEKKQEAEEEVVKALKELSKSNVIVLCVSNLLGKIGELGKSYRSFCRTNYHKFISSTGLTGLKNEKFNDLIKSLDIDYTALRKNGLRIKKIFDSADEIRVTTESGTDLIFNVKGMESIANVGLYNKAGHGGNIPTGEVYIPPVTGGVEGQVIIDGSIRYYGGTVIVDRPVRMSIANGKVANFQGPDAHLIEKTLVEAEKRAKYPERIRLIGELGIGINSGAGIIGSTIVDEKTLGTAHIAIGSNYWFGGDIKTIIHIDQVFKNPKVFVDGQELKI